MKNFGIIGVAGFVAPKHLIAIRDTRNQLIVAMDPHDNVGILDNFFPDSQFFSDSKQFEQFVDESQSLPKDLQLHYLTICSPSHLHSTHIHLALNHSVDAICEKPIVIHPDELTILSKLEETSGKKIYGVSQLRHHPSLIQFKQFLDGQNPRTRARICLTYITRRGRWYQISWKGSEERSGGLALNIGFHLFDLLTWLYGLPKRSEVHLSTPDTLAGWLELEHADVQWFLSLNSNYLPERCLVEGRAAYRSMLVDEVEVDFSEVGSDLHTKTYETILSGHGYRIEDLRVAIELAYSVQHSKIVERTEHAHPLVLRSS